MKIYYTILSLLFLNLISAQSIPFSLIPNWKVGDKYLLVQKDSSQSISPEGEVKIEKEEDLYNIEIIMISDEGFIIETLLPNPLDIYDESIVNSDEYVENLFETPKLAKTMKTSFLISKDCKKQSVFGLEKLKLDLINKKENLLKQYADDPDGRETMSSIYDEAINLGLDEENLKSQAQTVLHFFLFQYGAPFQKQTDTILSDDLKPHPFNPGEKMEVILKRYISSNSPMILKEEVIFDNKIFVEFIEKMKQFHDLSDNKVKNSEAINFDQKSYILGFLNQTNNLIDSFEGVVNMEIMGGSLFSISKIKIVKIN